MFRQSLFAALFFSMSCFCLIADEPASKDSAKPEFKAEFPKETISETKHTIQIAGKTIAYTATAGTIVLKEEDGRPKASVFYIAYARDGADPSTRPVTFSFNGGPGSSSVWLHMGLLGPKRVKLKDDGTAYPPPYPYWKTTRTRCSTSPISFSSIRFHRLQPRRAGRRSQAIFRRQGRHRIRRRFHPAVHHALQALVVAEIPDRRKLRNDAGGRAGRLPAGARRHVFQRRDSRLCRHRFCHSRFHPRQRDCRFSCTSPPTPPPPGITKSCPPTCSSST